MVDPNAMRLQVAEAAQKRNRTVRLTGTITSVSLDPEFWSALDEIASETGHSRSKLLREIQGRQAPNFASQVRVYVLEYYVAKVKAARLGDLQQ
jgi:predicted DNA-binding ribbon-helix-helix protein